MVIRQIFSGMSIFEKYLFTLVFAFALGSFFFCSTELKKEEQEEANERLEQTAPAEDFFQQRSYPDQFFDYRAYVQAIKNAQQQGAFRSDDKGFDAPWTSQGPGNIGARINCLAIHPTNPNIIYLGYSAGGLWKTTDGGATWNPIFDQQSYMAIGALAIDPKTPTTIYAGTGDLNISAYPFIGNGLWKSTDSGATWTYVGLAQGHIISKIIIDPSVTKNIYVSCMGQPFQRDEERGVYKTADGGATWTKSLFVSNQAGVIDMVMQPNNPSVLYAASFDRIRNNQESITWGSNCRIYKTTNGGTTWTQLTSGIPASNVGRIGLAVTAAQPNYVFACFTDITSTGQELKGIFRSTNNGTNWSDISTSVVRSSLTGGMGWYFGKITVNPKDEKDITVLGVDVWNSKNAGSLWSSMTGWSDVHADAHCMEYDKNGKIFLGTDGGLYSSVNNGSSWEDAEKIPTTQFYHVNYNPFKPFLYYGGAQDNGTIAGNSSMFNNWQTYYGGDGFHQVFHPTDSMILFTEWQRGAIMRSTDGGSNFASATTGINTVDRRSWDCPYIMSHHDPNVLYMGTYRMYRTDTINAAPYWKITSQNLTDAATSSTSSFNVVTTIDESWQTPKKLYVGTSDGNLWRSTDTGATWDTIMAGLPNRYVTSVRTSPTKENTIYVTYSGYRDGDNAPRIHKSTDNGNTWVGIAGDLPQLAINDLYILPNRGDSVLFVGTDAGVYASKNGGTTWARLGKNMPYIPVYDVNWNEKRNELLAATHARGIMTYPIDSLLPKQYFTLAGKIRTVDGTGIGQVKLATQATATTTNTDGLFQFNGLSENTAFSIKPSKDINPKNGLTTLDLVLIQKHIVGVQYFDTPYKYIAADINKSNTVTTADMVALRKIILGIDATFVNNTSWRFVEAAYLFPASGNPLSQPFPESVSIPLIKNTKNNLDFVGVKIGDLNNSNNAALAAPRNDASTQTWQIEDQNLAIGQTYSIPIKASSAQTFLGCQFALNIDVEKITLQSILFQEKPLDKSNFSLKNGVLKISYVATEGIEFAPQEIVFTLVVKANTATTVANLLRSNVYELRPESYDVQETAHPLHFEWLPQNGTFVPQLYPNPATNYTKLSFEITQTSNLDIILYDLSGRKIRTYALGQRERNRYEEHLDLTGLEKGIYLVVLEMNGVRMGVKKLILDNRP